MEEQLLTTYSFLRH